MRENGKFAEARSSGPNDQETSLVAFINMFPRPNVSLPVVTAQLALCRVAWDIDMNTPSKGFTNAAADGRILSEIESRSPFGSVSAADSCVLIENMLH